MQLVVDASLATVGLRGFQRRSAHTLSGGERQRLAVAGALAQVGARFLKSNPETNPADLLTLLYATLGIKSGLVIWCRTALHMLELTLRCQGIGSCCIASCVHKSGCKVLCIRQPGAGGAAAGRADQLPGCGGPGVGAGRGARRRGRRRRHRRLGERMQCHDSLYISGRLWCHVTPAAPSALRMLASHLRTWAQLAWARSEWQEQLGSRTSGVQRAVW